MRKDEHKFHFRRIIKKSKPPRSLVWTVSMLIFVIGLIVYLNLKSRGI